MIRHARAVDQRSEYPTARGPPILITVFIATMPMASPYGHVHVPP